MAIPALFTSMAIAGGVLFAALKDAKTVLASLAPAFQDVQKSISANFWAQAATPIKSMVGDLLPRLRGGLNNVATSLGSVFGQLATSIKNVAASSNIGVMFSRLAQGIDLAKGAVQPLVASFVTLGEVGSTVLPRLGSWVANVATSFNGFIQYAAKSGELTQWLEGGITALKNLGSIIVSVGSSLKGIYDAANAVGGLTLGGFANGLKTIADLINLPAFQGFLTTLFQGASDAFAGLSQALGPVAQALQTLAPPFAQIMRIAGELAGAVLTTLSNVIVKNKGAFGGLVGVVQTAANILTPFLSFISDNAQAFTALAVTIGVVVGAIKLWAVAQAILNIALAANPIGLIITLVAGLVAGIVYLATQTTFFQDAWKAMTDFIGSAIQASAVVILAVFKAISDSWNSTIAVIQAAWSAVWNFVVSIVRNYIATVVAVIRTIIAVWTVITTAMSTVWNAAWNAISSFVGAIIDGIKGFFNGLIDAARNTAAWIKSIFDGIGDAVGAVGNFLSGHGGASFGVTATMQHALAGPAGVGGSGFLLTPSLTVGSSAAPTIVSNNYSITIEANNAYDPQAVGKAVIEAQKTYFRSIGANPAGGGF